MAKKRPLWSHKGDFGKALVLAGSKNFTGVPFLSGLAALGSGADLVHVTGHPRAMDAVAFQTPDLITHPLKGEFEPKEVKTVLDLAKAADVVLLGGGLPRTAATHRALLELIKKLKKPMVLDAEALRALHGNTAVLKGKTALLTPHADEFHAFTGERVSNNMKDREQKVKKWAAQLKVVILLKGHVDIISDGKMVFQNKTGTPFMTKGGTGDVLAGLCAGFMAQKFSHLEAAKKAATLNGKAGERASKKHGATLLASHLLEELN